MSKRTIVINAMGGDYAPQAPVEGALLCLEKYPDLSIVLTGKEDAINKILSGKTYDKERLTIVNTTEVVENEEKSPVQAIRTKKDSSLVVGLRMVKDKKADGMISAGNTGSVMAGATFLVGRIKGVFRPALSVELPTGKNPTLVLDLGANMDCKPQYLVQFAQMASIYYHKLHGIENPTVALLNVGVEPTKGNQLAKEAYQALSECKTINFKGNAEAREIFEGNYNIVVTDGFAGNVMLKTTEGVASYIFTSLKKEIKSSFAAKLGALLMLKSLKKMKNSLDPRRVGGSALLGINGAVIKAHGNSRQDSFVSAMDQCLTFINNQVIGDISDALEKEETNE